MQMLNFLKPKNDPRKTSIQIFENHMPFYFCEELISAFEFHDEFQVLDEHGENQNKIKSTSMLLSGHTEALAHADHRTFRSMGEAIKKYFGLYGGMPQFGLQDSGYIITKYGPGSSCGLHFDSVICPQTKRARVATFVLFLNEPVKGGELYFPWQDVKIKPKEGMLVAFPPSHTHPHKVLEVVRGERYSLTTWVLADQT